MKRILVLGTSYLQTFLIRKAKENGYYVIGVDGNANSVGFSFCDKYFVCSTTDKEGVLSISEKEKVDGIITYASDVSAPTVSYVAEKLGLDGDPYSSVLIMTDKYKTRQFLKKNGFNVPQAFEVSNYNEFLNAISLIGYPLIVKPIDSSGSKGVCKLESLNKAKNAYDYSMSFSREKKIIVEEFLERKGYQVDADCFWYKDRLAYFQPMDQHRDPLAPFSPVGISGPSLLDGEKADIAFKEVSRFLGLLNMSFGEYNVEYIFDKNDKLYILEIGPRAGGNLIPNVIQYGTGIDLPLLTLKACVGEPLVDVNNHAFKKNVTSLIIHSQVDGIFSGLAIDERLKNRILIMDLFVKEGDRVHRFTGASTVIGFAMIEFDDLLFMKQVMDNTKDYFKVLVK